MNKVRRALLISMPLGALMGLSGCKIDLVGASEDSNVETVSDGEQAFANGRALRVSPVSEAVDGLFQSGTGEPYFVPDSTLVQGCINTEAIGEDLFRDNLYLTLWQGVGDQQRAVALTLPELPINPDVDSASYYLDSKTYDIADLDNALVVVTVLGSGDHYDYQLTAGTVTVSGLSAFSLEGEITLVFTGVVGEPTSLDAVPNNEAAQALQLDGTIRLTCREELAALMA